MKNKKLLSLSAFAIILVVIISVCALAVSAAAQDSDSSLSDALEVKKLIDEIVDIQKSESGLSAEHKDKVDAARKAYDALSDEAKFLLEDHEPKLKSAEEVIKELDRKPVELDPMNRETILTALDVLWKGMLAIFVVIAIIIVVVKLIQTVIIKITTPPEEKKN